MKKFSNVGMRCLLMLAFFVLLMACKSGIKQDRRAFEKKSEEEAAPIHSPDARIIPIKSSTGVVAAVNVALRFVILDYAMMALPKPDQILFIYRRGQKVAKVRVSGPIRGQSIAADILEGVAEKGDEVRAE